MGKDAFCAVSLSPSCKNNCVFCGSAPLADADELERQERAVAKSLEEHIMHGFENIEITGHDPIEYESIIQLIGYMKKEGFNNIMLSTHGRRLHDKEFLRGLASAGLTSLRIPIYGSTAAVHDSVTRAEGSFKETTEGLRLLRDFAPHIKILLHSLILKQNKEDLKGIVSLAKRLGINQVSFSISCVANNDYSYYVSIKDLPPYLKKLIDYGKKEGVMIFLADIPFCVFERDVPERGVLIRNDNLVPELGTYCQPPAIFRSGIKNMPSYRIKKKTYMCEECKYDSACAGFYFNDINVFGTGSLKPIKKHN